MRKLFFGLMLAIGARSAWSDCTDTTILLKAGTAGFTAVGGAVTTSTYDPSSLNGLIRGCAGATMTVRLNLDATEAGKTKDTVKLTGPILIANRGTGKTTSLSMLRPASLNGALDSIFTFVDNGTSAPLLVDSSGNVALISNMAFARKVINSSENTITLLGKGSQVSACHFWTADKDGDATGALVFVAADSVLVERSLFRTTPDGRGRSYAIRGASPNPMSKLEIRANVFQSTGVFIGMNGPFHIIANTFVGSRNQYNPILVSSAIGTNYNNAVIMHNLFAAKVDTLPPIAIGVSGTITSDSIIRNAYTQGKTGLALAVNDPAGASANLRGATGANINVALPKGFSNYGPNAGDVKDYPLTELRSDPTLARKNPDFGKVYRVFLTGSWSGSPAAIPDIAGMTTRMYFPGFTSFLPGKPWTGTTGANVKVGAFVDWDDVETPSPLAAGVQGASFKLQKDSGSTDKAKITLMKFDDDYYKQFVPPATVYFFFSNTLSKLTASNDTTALKAAGNPAVPRPWLNFDSVITVPKEVRNAGADIFVKMLQFKAGYMAPVLSTAAIGTLSKFPGFPVNDLALTLLGSDSPNRTVTLKVTRGTEQIDSVRIEAMIEGGKVVDSKSVPATPASGLASISFIVSAKGTYTFQAVPVASVGGGTFKSGAPTAATAPVSLGITASDSIYVSYKAAGCPGATGELATPYCLLDSALKAASTRNGGTTIIVRNASPVVNLETLTIDPLGPGDTSAITITSGLFNDNRPIIRGTATKEALVISRKNVTLRGFTIEQPAAGTKTALVIKAGGCLIDANIFRASAKGAVAAAAIGLEVGATAEARIVNNVVWGFAKGVQFTSTTSPNVKILFNTFVADSTLNTGATAGIYAAGPDSVKAVIADNFFSGQTSAVDKDLTGSPVLDHNVRTAGASLNGKPESGGLGASSAIPAKDIWVAGYTAALKDAMNSVVECNSFSPCNPIYGGSSTNEYNVTVTTDVFGSARKNRKEVGAYEYPANPSGVLGVLEIKPTLITNNFRTIDFTVTGLSFDSAAAEADSVQVFWAKSDVSQNLTPNLDAIPSNQRKSYPITLLVDKPIKDKAEGIESELTKYWFFAALSRNATHTARTLGYPYSDTLTSGQNFQYGKCDFKDSKIACPSEIGAFAVDTGLWKNTFLMRVKLAKPVDTGSAYVNPPRYIPISEAQVNQYNLDLASPLPIFEFDAHIPGLGVEDSPQKLTWEIEFNSAVDLSGLNLFLLPKDPKGLPVLVPDWKITSLGATKSRITFESTTDGVQSYAFGKLQATLEPGLVLPAYKSVPIYDFIKVPKDTAYYPIPVTLKTSGFKTGNPLVLISTIPAGGTVYPPSGSKALGVISGDPASESAYPSRTVVISSGYADLPADLRKTRLYQLYLKAVTAEAISPAPQGQRKPFVLDSVSFGKFDSSTVALDADLDLAGGEMTVQVPIGKYFNDFLRQLDNIGKATRSLEVVFTVFDGSRISRTRGFIRTKFYKQNVQISEHYNRKSYKASKPGQPHWNLFGYPWDETEGGSLARLFERKEWDKDHMRLWSYKGTGNGAGAYGQYDGSNAGSIQFDSGMAVWTGATDDYTPQTESGMSLDYQPFKMDLAANRFYDFSLPFNFPMKWQDILDSSGLTIANAPSVWHYNDSTLPPKWDKVLLAAASPAAKGSVLVPWEGYTLKSLSPVSLTFPVMDTSRSTTPVAKAAAGDGSWAVEVEASDASAAMELRIGRGTREMLSPEPPDVPGQDFRVSLVKGDQKISEYIQSLEGGWQGHWALRGNAAKGSGGLALRIGDASREVPIWLVDAMHGTAVALSAAQPVRVSEEELQANDYHLVAGDRAYVDQVLSSLTPGHLLALSNYPNPFSGSTLFRYALPAGFGKTTFDLKVRDFRGRTVWQKTIVAGNALSYLWDGRDRSGMPLPAGVYSLSLTAKAENKAAYRAVRNLLRM